MTNLQVSLLIEHYSNSISVILNNLYEELLLIDGIEKEKRYPFVDVLGKNLDEMEYNFVHCLEPLSAFKNQIEQDIKTLREDKNE